MNVRIHCNVEVNITDTEPDLDSLVAWWDCSNKTNEDADRDTIKDKSGNNNNLKLYNFSFNKDSEYEYKIRRI